MQYQWNIENLTRLIADGLVYKVKYRYETYQDGFLVYKKGEITLSGSSSDPNFESFQNLNEETVLGWITGSLPVSTFQTELSSSLALLIDGTYIEGTPSNFYPVSASLKDLNVIY